MIVCHGIPKTWLCVTEYLKHAKWYRLYTTYPQRTTHKVLSHILLKYYPTYSQSTTSHTPKVVHDDNPQVYQGLTLCPSRLDLTRVRVCVYACRRVGVCAGAWAPPGARVRVHGGHGGTRAGLKP